MGQLGGTDLRLLGPQAPDTRLSSKAVDAEQMPLYLTRHTAVASVNKEYNLGLDQTQIIFFVDRGNSVRRKLPEVAGSRHGFPLC